MTAGGGAFTPEQHQQLTQLRLLPEQIVELTKLLPMICTAISKPPAYNAVRNRLKDIRGHAKDLSGALAKLLNFGTSDADLARNLIDQQYFAARPADEGPMVPHALRGRLAALVEACDSALASLPSKPSRHRSADPRPVAQVDAALTYGWRRANQGSKTIPRYPRRFRPSHSESSHFREVVAICYDAAGKPNGAKRAIEAYVTALNAERQAMVAMWTHQLEQAK